MATALTTLVCKIAIGAASLTLHPQIIQTPRYDGAEVRLVFDGGQLTDIVVDGPYDRQYSYLAHGLVLTSVRLADRVLIDVRGEGLDATRESMILTDSGHLAWVQIANADQLRSSAGSLFIGACK